MAHKTISQWLRNADLLVMHQCVLESDPFKIDSWLVAAYVKKQCNHGTTKCARVAFKFGNADVIVLLL